MDRRRTKKIRSARVIATNIFMGLSVVAIVAVLMLIAMGFTFNKGQLEQSGLLQISSRPSRATVEIDGEQQFSPTEINKMLSASEHRLRITKTGYDAWEKTINLDAGLLTRIEWVRLFPINRDIKTTDTFDTLRLIAYSPDRRYVLTSAEGATSMHYIALNGDKTTHTRIDLITALGSDDATVRQGALELVAWNHSGNRVIIKWHHDDAITWHMIDLNDEAKSVNLTKKYNLDFSDVLIANDAASKLWAVENGNLRTIDLSSRSVSSVSIAGIEKIANNNDVIAYVAKVPNFKSVEDRKDNKAQDTVPLTNEDENSEVITYERALYTYREGEDGSVKIIDLKDADEVNFTMGTYWGEEWIAYSLNKNIYLASGKYPTYKKGKNTTLKTTVSHLELEWLPEHIQSNIDERIIVFSSNQSIASIDVETKDYFDFTNDSGHTIRFIDNFLVWESTGDKLIVRDFDGDNRRIVIDDGQTISNAIISENDKWLYYFDIVEQIDATTETAKTATDNKTATEDVAPKYSYILKRMKLEI